MIEKLEVIASFDWFKEEETVGMLSHNILSGQDVYSFEYSKEWLRNHGNLIPDKELRPFIGLQSTLPGEGLFVCFSDCVPDYWGQKLIGFKENKTGKLSDWEYLLGVQDELRIGGFRFKDPDSGLYVNSSDGQLVPPLLDLEELCRAAQEIEDGEFKREGPERRWIERLFAPGSSVGGARPKASIKEGSDLFIAKFPSRYDGPKNDARWEYFLSKLAKNCGVNTAEGRIVSLPDGQDVFLSKRFDRTQDGRRIHMVSALNLMGLRLDERYGHGYPELADLIVSSGTKVEESLQELYRRVAVNICVSNGDDHLKNHSFLLTNKGWELSPAYDITPDGQINHSLTIDGKSNVASLDNLYAACERFYLDERTAFGIIKDVTREMKYWELTAKDCGISSSEADMYAQRFESGITWKYGDGGRSR